MNYVFTHKSPLGSIAVIRGSFAGWIALMPIQIGKIIDLKF